LYLSLVGRFDLDVYILNISTTDGHSLGSLFAELLSRYLFLLEDIDAVGVVRTRQGEIDITQAKEDAT